MSVQSRIRVCEFVNNKAAYAIIVQIKQFRPSYSHSFHPFIHTSSMEDAKRKRNDDTSESDKRKRNAVDNNNKPTHAPPDKLTEGGKSNC